jgi:hypothetical protein
LLAEKGKPKAALQRGPENTRLAMTWRFARSWQPYGPRSRRFQGKFRYSGVLFAAGLNENHAGQAFSGNIAPKLRSGKCDAGNLASFSHLHKNYTICRLGIHF